MHMMSNTTASIVRDDFISIDASLIEYNEDLLAHSEWSSPSE